MALTPGSFQIYFRNEWFKSKEKTFLSPDNFKNQSSIYDHVFT